ERRSQHLEPAVQRQHINHTHPGHFSMETPGHFSVAINSNHPDLFQTVVNKPCDKEMVLTGIRDLMKIAKIEEGSSFRFTRRAGTVGA
ncbi:hypothetical protein, partial [Novosphingobium guangzhouense]|uniref:hypothetical protein n=1 Tax=Novosphingobium guangzhouense TaxID=1850347 RepID=UPI001B80318A